MTALEEKIEELRKRITAFDLDFDQGEALDELISMIPAVQSIAYAEGERAGFKKAHKVLMQDAKRINELKDELDITRNTANALEGNNRCLKADLAALMALGKETDKHVAKLTAERDALLADVKDYQGSICCYCKHIVRDNEKKKVYCGCFGDFPTSDGGIPLMCGRWEWRGVNHD